MFSLQSYLELLLLAGDEAGGGWIEGHLGQLGGGDTGILERSGSPGQKGGRGWPGEVPRGGDQLLGGGKGLKCVGRGDVNFLYCLAQKLLRDLV